MTPEQFCYWLQGRCELLPAQTPSEDEWRMITAHLQTVFNKVTPVSAKEVPPIPVSIFQQMGQGQKRLGIDYQPTC